MQTFPLHVQFLLGEAPVGGGQKDLHAIPSKQHLAPVNCSLHVHLHQRDTHQPHGHSKGDLRRFLTDSQGETNPSIVCGVEYTQQQNTPDSLTTNSTLLFAGGVLCRVYRQSICQQVCQQDKELRAGFSGLEGYGS